MPGYNKINIDISSCKKVYFKIEKLDGTWFKYGTVTSVRFLSWVSYLLNIYWIEEWLRVNINSLNI